MLFSRRRINCLYHVLFLKEVLGGVVFVLFKKHQKLCAAVVFHTVKHLLSLKRFFKAKARPNKLDKYLEKLSIRFE